jgi:HK97 family phage major capsid protein
MSEELKAIEAISTQIDGFKTTLADKANKADFDRVEATISELKEGLNTLNGRQVESKMEEINAAISKFGKAIEEMQEDIAKSKEPKGGKSKGQFLSTEEVKAFIDATFKDGRKTSDSARIEMKAPESMGAPAFFQGASGTIVDAFTGREVDPTLYQRKRKRNLVLDHLPVTAISVPKLVYLVKVEIGTGTAPDNLSGGADWIASGAAKPQRSFRVTTGEAEAKKVAIYGNVHDKLLRDVASMENWIREDFMDEILEAYNDALLNNDPGSNADAPLGIKTEAVQFAATPAFDETIPLPNYIDGIIAVLAFMADNKEQPGKVFVSDDVFYAIHNLKATDGKYLNNNLVYVNNVGQLFIAGVQVIPADSDDVPSTHLLAVGADLGFKIRNYGPMVFERGLNGNDFREDKTSYRGYQEVLSYIPENRVNSVVYDTWANILVAIAAPEVGG